MKNNWTLRIVIFTFVCYGLAAFLGKLAGKQKINDYSQAVADIFTNSENVVRVYTKEAFESEKLEEINILTIGNDVKIEKSNDKKTHVDYYKNNNGSEKNLIIFEEKKINIDLSKSVIPKNKFIINMNFGDDNPSGIFVTKDHNQFKLIIQIPDNIKKININTVSGDIEIKDVALETVQIESVSGNVKLNGEIKELKANTVSGDIKYLANILNPNIKISTISGDSKLLFKQEPEIVLNFNTTSGHIDVDQSFLKTELEGSVKELKIGKGKSIGQLNIDSVSGDLSIEKNRNSEF